MPPLFSASNWTTLVRGVLKTARASSTTAAKSKGSKVQQAQRAVRQLVQSTYRSLASPPLQPSLQPIRLTIRPYSTISHAPTSPYAGIRSSFRVHRYSTPYLAPSGPAAVASVGLGNARNFGLRGSRGYATAASSAAPANIPIACRTFMPYLADEDRFKSMPKGTVYRPYGDRRQRKTRRKSRKCWKDSLSLLASIDSVDSVLIRGSSNFASAESLRSYVDYRRYFRPPQAIETPIRLPLQPEQLVTPGRSTVLAVPLSEDLSDILMPTTEISYRDAEIGVNIFANLTAGLLPIHDALMLYGSTHIHPLIAKLDGLGLLRGDSEPSVEMVVGYLGERPDILRLIFSDRSEGDVKTLIGESLDFPGDNRWFTLYERSSLPAPVPALTLEESAEISAEAAWRSAPSESAQRRARQQIATSDTMALTADLRLPGLDASGAMLQLITQSNTASYDFGDDTPPEMYSWPSSGSSSPLPADLNMTTVPPRLPAIPLLASLPIFDYVSPPASDVDSWSADISDSDLEVDSALEGSIIHNLAESEVWSEADSAGQSSSVISGHHTLGPLMPR